MADANHQQQAGTRPNGSGTKPNGATTSPDPSLRAWTAEDFIARTFPPKEPLLKGLLHRRDMVALGARRRHGKTSLITNIAVAGAIPRSEFLGYEIPQAFRSLLFILEDDAGEYQEKLRRVIGPSATGGRIRIVNREDFYRAGIRIDVTDASFRSAVQSWAGHHKPDLIVFDNLAQIISADYNDATRVHELMRFCSALAGNHSAAIILPAHPKKADMKNPISLLDNPDTFFESIMGSSHFINSTGNLWGLERCAALDHSAFLGGRQRGDGHQGGSYLGMDADGWFYLIDEAQKNLPLVLNTPGRRQAWAALPDPPITFGYREGEALVKSVMRSGSTFQHWIKECRRLGVVIEANDGKTSKKPGLKPWP
jgi:AAA domain